MRPEVSIDFGGFSLLGCLVFGDQKSKLQSSLYFLYSGTCSTLKHNPTIISGQNSIQNYLTKPKTLLKKEENAHIHHQQLPQQKTEYSPRNSSENHQNHRGKQEPIHSHTNAPNIHIQHCDQGSKRPETSQSSKCSGNHPIRTGGSCPPGHNL